jgi:putative Holliday junction resolvase
MRILALDIGDKRIGVAMSDPMGILASPLTIIERQGDEPDTQAIIDLVKKHGAGKIIAGLPVSLDGKIGGQAQKVQLFVEKLLARLTVPVEYRDERFTTVSARQLMQETQKKGKPDRRKDDAFAAALLLQEYLDELNPATTS